MSLLLLMPGRDPAPLAAALRAELPGERIECWPRVRDPDAVRFAVLWQHPPGVLGDFPRLAAVSSFGAGVDSILADPDLPAGLPVGRIVDPDLGRQVAAYVLAHVLERVRELPRLRAAQQRGEWLARTEPYRASVGVLGLGRIGSAVARAFLALGYPVHGWSRGARPVEGVTVHRRLAALAGAVDYLVCALPATPETSRVLDRQLFRAMRPSAVLINVGRGEQLVEDDLLAALAAGELAGAVLDVFSREPLPPAHPFWSHERITVTPHVAGLTDPAGVARRIAASYRSVRAGAGVLDPVDRARGY